MSWVETNMRALSRRGPADRRRGCGTAVAAGRPAHGDEGCGRARCSAIPAAPARAVIVGLLALASAACELGVENPGAIEDDALNDPRAVPPLVVGMGADLSAVLDEVAYFMGIASRDIYHTGAFEAEFFMQDGDIEPRHVNGLWADMHGARWVAEQGIGRLETILGDGFAAEPLVTQAHLWAGFSNRVLGENVCVAVIDGVAPAEYTVHFERAEAYFTTAIELAEAQGETVLRDVAYAGRAQVRAALGKWAEAADDAARVPAGTVFEAKYSDNSDREWNWLVNESHIRRYFSVYGTFAADITDDPRVPWEDEGVMGVDGLTPFYRQDKYTELGSEIQLVAGDEMRLIQAEAALRLNGDVDGAMAIVNAVRADAGVPAKAASGEDEAWAALRMERAIVLWMEGRRLWELRRFDDPFLADRDRCIPPSLNEQNTNPNLPGT